MHAVKEGIDPHEIGVRPEVRDGVHGKGVRVQDRSQLGEGTADAARLLEEVERSQQHGELRGSMYIVDNCSNRTGSLYCVL